MVGIFSCFFSFFFQRLFQIEIFSILDDDLRERNVIYIYIISRDLYNFLLQGMNWNAEDRIEGKGMKKGDFASRHWHGFVS